MTNARVEPIGRRLRAEWQRLRHDPTTLAAARRWDIVAPGDLSDLDQVLRAVGYGVPADTANEAALHRLVAHARVDPVAARTVLQRILPGLVATSARRSPHDRGAAVDELVGAAWICIATYDARRSPRCLAAALVDAADHLAFRKATRRKWTGEIAGAIDLERVPAADDDAVSELAAVFRMARAAHVDEADLDLLRRLLVAERADDVAAELRVTARTVRNRRARVTDRLRELAIAA